MTKIPSDGIKIQDADSIVGPDDLPLGLVLTSDMQAAISALSAVYQIVLVSGTNIKTVNGTSLLGSGNITVSAGGAWGAITGTLSAQTDLQGALDLKANAANAALTGTPTTPTATAGTNTTQIASTAFVKTAVETAVVGLYEEKGPLDCAANPNYPTGLKGDVYRVTVAGRIGGASGVLVDIGDAIICHTDNAGGTQAAVGISWYVLQTNLIGALIAANNLSDISTPATARTNLGLAIGTNVQAWNAFLDTLAAINSTSGTGAIMRVASPTITGTLTAADITFTGRLENTGTNVSNSMLRVGSLEFQPYTINNAWIGENIYFNGSGFRHRATGAGGLFYFQGNEGQFRFAASASAGSTMASGVRLKTHADGRFAVGPSVSETAGNMTGAAFLVDASGNGTFIGSVTIGSGTAITKVLSATATLNFGSIAAGGFEDLTITVTGATVGNTAIANPPTGSVTNNITYDAWISASNTVTVRASNNNLITAMDPASGTFRATVIQF